MGFNPAPALLGWWHWVWPCFFDARLWDGERFQLDTPEGRAAMRWIHDRRRAAGLQAALKFEAVAGAIEGAQNPFLSGRIAMVFQGPWMGTWARAYAPDLDFGVAPFPSVSAERMNVFASADVFAIPRGAPHPREAMTFIAYVLRQEVMEELCRLHGKVSPYREPQPDFFENHPHREFIRVFDEMASSPYAFGHPKMPTFAEASQEMLFMLESVLQGQRGPDEAVRDTQAKVDAVVADYDRKRAARRGGGGD
jgi:ABC-type glycerol-3-phosphate transport system substrate-binding protein